MNMKFSLLGLAAAACLSVPATADILEGRVYSVSDSDVYIVMEDSTVARVPRETAYFKVDGVTVSGGSLSVGQQVVADYTPVYGFQRYYHTSSDAPNTKTVYIIQDVSPDDISVIEWDGRLYRLSR